MERKKIEIISWDKRYKTGSGFGELGEKRGEKLGIKRSGKNHLYSGHLRKKNRKRCKGIWIKSLTVSEHASPMFGAKCSRDKESRNWGRVIGSKGPPGKRGW